MIKLLKNSLFGLLLLTPLTALMVFDSLIFPFITGKAFFFRIIIDLAVGIYLSLWVLDANYRPKKSILSLCIWIFAIIVMIADIFAPNPTQAFWSNFERMEGFVAIAHFILYFFVASNVFKKREDWNRFFYVCTGVSVYLICFAVLQLAHEFVINQGGVRVDGTIGNAAYFAIYLVFQIAILALLWQRNKSDLKGIAESVYLGIFGFISYYIYYISSPMVNAEKPGKILCVLGAIIALIVITFRFSVKNQKLKRFFAHLLFSVITILNIVLLYLTATRGAILGFIGGVTLASIIFALFAKENPKLRKTSIAVLGFVVGIIVLFFSFKNTDFVKNDPVLSRFASISWNETKDQARSYIWPMAIEGAKENPALGWGQEGFIYVFNKYYNPLMWRHEPWFDRSHNSFLDWLVNAGVLGLLSYLSIFVSAIYLIIKKNKADIFEKGILLGTLSAYAFNNVFIFDNILSYFFLFSFLALIHSETTEKEIVNSHVKNQEGAGTLAALFIGLSLVAVYFVNVKPLRQNLALADAMKVVGVKGGELISCVNVDAQKQDNGQYKNVCLETGNTLDLFDNAINKSPVGTTEAREQLLRLSGEINPQAQIPGQVKEAVAKKVIEEYKKQISGKALEARDLLTFGSYLNTIGLNDSSINILSKALELSPKKPQIALELARVYVDAGDNQTAYNFAEMAYLESPLYPEAKIIYAILSLSLQKIDQATKLIGEVADAGIADQRIVEALTKIFGKEKAKVYLNQVLKADPSNETAKKMLEVLSK